MAIGERDFNLEQLKTNPKMWTRLATRSSNGNTMENVFKEKDNPFEKNSIAAMETIQRLAAEGNLYLREYGRSRHFHKVEKDGNELKLGEQHEMKISNRNSDPILGGLMWLSRGYFKWIGLEKVANWFDERLKQRTAIKDLDKRYKEEYKSLTKEEKNELKAIRKHEKKLKALEKAQKEAEKAQQEIDKIRGKDTSKSKEEMDSPLSEPPKQEPEKNTMQPTLEGDQPVREQKQAQETRENNLVQEKVAQEEIPGTKKAAPEKNDKKAQFFIDGVELTEETEKQFPEHIVKAFKLIQQLIDEMEAVKQANQQPVQEQPAEVKENAQSVPETQPEATEITQEENVQKEGTLIDLDDLGQNVAENNENTQKIDLAELESIFQNTAAQQEGPVEEVKAEMTAPLTEPPKVEEDKVGIHGRPKEQEQPTLQERLAAEKEAMDSVVNWKDRLVNTLFSHEEGGPVRDYYDLIKDQQAGSDFLAGTVCGLLATGAGNPESMKQIMDGLLSGKPLGNEYDNRISEGVIAYNQAVEQMNKGDKEPLVKLITDAALELGKQASLETSLSPRHAMIGRMISNAMSLADEHQLDLPLGPEDWCVIRGAAELSKLAQKHHDAKQHLANGNLDFTKREDRNAVRDLLMGNAVENMLRVDQKEGQQLTNTQVLMGSDYLSVKNLSKMMNATTVRATITAEQVMNLMTMPDSYNSAKMAKQLGDELLDISLQSAKSAEGLQKDMQKAQ